MAETPVVAVIMGSSSDWETMQHAVQMLERFGVPHERHIVSAHRTPVWMAAFASGAEAREANSAIHPGVRWGLTM